MNISADRVKELKDRLAQLRYEIYHAKWTNVQKCTKLYPSDLDMIKSMEIVETKHGKSVKTVTYEYGELFTSLWGDEPLGKINPEDVYHVTVKLPDGEFGSRFSLKYIQPGNYDTLCAEFDEILRELGNKASFLDRFILY